MKQFTLLSIDKNTYAICEHRISVTDLPNAIPVTGTELEYAIKIVEQRLAKDNKEHDKHRCLIYDKNGIVLQRPCKNIII